MDFFKVKKFSKTQKESRGSKQQEEEGKNESNCVSDLGKPSPKTDHLPDFEDDDDDFITNEVKRRLKELRMNSFMELIPEEDESFVENEEEEDEGSEEEGETRSAGFKDVETEISLCWGGFDAAYDTYCDRMLFFDRMSSQRLHETRNQAPTTPSPRSASKKLPSPLRCLSLKRIEEPDDETEPLQFPEIISPYQDLETAYVAQVCLTWEALHCQYTQLSLLVSCQPEKLTCYNHSAQAFQQFQVLLQRFMENEPFEQGLRPEIYARTRNVMPKLLQVPHIQGSDKKQRPEEELDLKVLASDLIKVIENSILTFHGFLKSDKKKQSGVLNMFGNQNSMATPLHQVQSSLEKRRVKLKEVCKRTKGWKTKSWPQARDGVQLLLSVIDVKVMSRVLRMVRINKEQLFWCEEKMKKLDLSYGKLHRDASPTLFPC